MQVLDLAKRLGVTPETVRFYTRNGVLKPAINPDNGYRLYREREFQRLRFVLNARQLGFSVDDIQEILSHADQDESACGTVRRLIEKRLEETEKRFEETRRLRDRMKQAVSEWRQKPDKEPTGDMICHLIEEFQVKD